MCTFDFSILSWALILHEVAPTGPSWVLIPHLRPRAVALGLVEVAPAGQSWVLSPRLRPRAVTRTPMGIDKHIFNSSRQRIAKIFGDLVFDHFFAFSDLTLVSLTEKNRMF